MICSIRGLCFQKPNLTFVKIPPQGWRFPLSAGTRGVKSLARAWAEALSLLARNHPVSKAPQKPVPASQAENSVGPLNSFRGAAPLSPGSWAPICTPVCLWCMLVSSRLPPHTTNSHFWPGLKRSSREAGPPGTHNPCWSSGSGLSGAHGLPGPKLCRAAGEVATGRPGPGVWRMLVWETLPRAIGKTSSLDSSFLS